MYCMRAYTTGRWWILYETILPPYIAHVSLEHPVQIETCTNTTATTQWLTLPSGSFLWLVEQCSLIVKELTPNFCLEFVNIRINWIFFSKNPPSEIYLYNYIFYISTVSWQNNPSLYLWNLDIIFCTESIMIRTKNWFWFGHDQYNWEIVHRYLRTHLIVKSLKVTQIVSIKNNYEYVCLYVHYYAIENNLRWRWTKLVYVYCEISSFVVPIPVIYRYLNLWPEKYFIYGLINHPSSTYARWSLLIM